MSQNFGSVDVADVFTAVGIGAFSASSLVLGAVVGIWKLPPPVLRAACMAFGAGALIEALAIELFAHIVARGLPHSRRMLSGRRMEANTNGGDPTMVYISLVAAFVGALFFSVLNKVLNDKGAFLRSAGTVKSYISSMRVQFNKNLTSRVRLVPMFKNLPDKSIKKMLNMMEKESFSKGAVIFQELDPNSSIYFLLTGAVHITVFSSVVPAPDEQRSIVDTFELRRNDVFGEMSLFMGQPVPAEAIAVEPTKVLRLPGDALHLFMQNEKSLRDFVAMMASERLRETLVFQNASPSTVTRLVTHMKQVSYDAGDVLFHDIDGLCPISLIVLGSVNVAYANGASVIVFQENDLLGTDHLIEGRSKHAVCTALEKTTVLTIDRSVFDSLIAHDDALRGAVMASRDDIAHEAIGTVSCSLALQGDRIARTGDKFGYLGVRTLPWRRDEVFGRSSRAYTETPVEMSHGLRGRFHSDVASSRILERNAGHKTLPPTLAELRSPSFTREPRSPTFSPLEPRSPERRFSTQDKVASETDSEPLPPLVDLSDIDLVTRSGALNADMLIMLQQHAGTPSAKPHQEDGPAYNLNEQEILESSAEMGGKHAAFMIWLGIMMDAIPESIVIGILLNSDSNSGSSLTAFVFGVFLANFPEAMSSSGTMKSHDVKTVTILLMWMTIVLLTGLGAGVGVLLFPPGSETSKTSLRWQAGIEGMAGGAMLAMISNTALPEAFEQGGDIVGMSCVSGFLVALLAKVVLS